ncbi:hypothetical protein T484DRAFT_3237524, partial [Baffinella frigidus]
SQARRKVGTPYPGTNCYNPKCQWTYLRIQKQGTPNTGTDTPPPMSEARDSLLALLRSKSWPRTPDSPTARGPPSPVPRRAASPVPGDSSKKLGPRRKIKLQSVVPGSPTIDASPSPVEHGWDLLKANAAARSWSPPNMTLQESSSRGRNEPAWLAASQSCKDVQQRRSHNEALDRSVFEHRLQQHEQPRTLERSSGAPRIGFAPVRVLWRAEHRNGSAVMDLSG